MLERMALFEQQVLNLRTALSNASDTSSASQSQYGLSVWEQTFRKKLDTVTPVHAEHFTIANHNSSTTCANPECDFIIPPLAKYCSCGMPTTILGLKCANPVYKMPCHGSLEQMCKQTVRMLPLSEPSALQSASKRQDGDHEGVHNTGRTRQVRRHTASTTK